jgi:putative SOS response-associated peptidase YedK
MYEEWNDREGKWLHTFTILTTTPNSLIAEIHNRTPVILDEKDYAVWLGEAEGDPAALMKPCPPCLIRPTPISPTSAPR